MFDRRYAVNVNPSHFLAPQKLKSTDKFVIILLVLLEPLSDKPRREIERIIFYGLSQDALRKQFEAYSNNNYEYTIQTTSSFGHTEEQTYIVGNEELKEKILAKNSFRVSHIQEEYS